MAVQRDEAERDRQSHGPRIHRQSRGSRLASAHGEEGRPRGRSIRLVGRYVRVLPARLADLVYSWRVLGRYQARWWARRSRASAARRWDAGQAPGRTRSRTDAFATHPHGCDGDRSSRRPRGESRSRQDGGSGWRWCSRPVRRDRCASTRRGAHHHSRQASGSHLTRARIRRLGCRERARRSGRGARQGAHERTRRTLGARVRGSRGIDAHRSQHRASRRRRGACGCAAGR